MSAAKLRGPSIVLALALMSGVLVLGQDPLVRTPPAPGPHPLQSLGRPVATATATRPGFDVLAWRRDFATLSSAEFRGAGAGKGTDVVLQGRADAMEALLAIDPDTSPSSIVLSLAADRGLTLGVDGAATGLVAGQPVRVSASFYQSGAGALTKVPGGFVVSGTQIALWAERGAAREPLIVSVRATFGTNRETMSAVAAFGVPQLTATVQVDPDGNAVASPGDTLRYQLRIPNIGDAAMTNVAANLPLDPNTAAVAGSLNVSPIALDQDVTINEDTPTPITLTGSDADGNALTYTVVTQPAHGGVVQASPGSAGVTYTPAANFNGTDTFTVKNNDGRVDSNEVATITVTVGPVNDAPSFTKGPNQSVVENSPAQSVTGWATAISPGPADETAQTITFEITNNTAPSLFSVAPAVSPSGTLTYTPAPTFSGTATISIRAHDSGGTGNGGVDVSPVVTFTIEIRGVNEAPSFTKGADQTVLEDSGAHTVAGWATGISPGVNEVGQTVTFEVTGNTNGALFAAGPAVASNGTLTFTPAANANGTATITLRARDDGGTSDGGVDVSATQTFIVNVTAVNDAPSFTKGADQTNLEDSGLHTVPTWATAIAAGPTDEIGQTLTFAVTNNTNPGLFTVAPVVSSTGTLTYTFAANMVGAATITLQLSDNGGTANGGADTSATQTFVITTTEVNDAPSFTKGPDQTVLEDAAAQTVSPWATAISAGANEGTQTVAFQITGNSNPTLFSAGPAVSPAGVLTYTPAANANGFANITLRITDNGGTADGGVDFSATQTFVINVTAVNDNPVADADAYGVGEGATLNVAAPGVLDGDTDVEGSSLTAQLVTGPAHASSFTLNADGSFSYTHNGSETPLTDSFTYQAFDGALLSNVATVTITITPVNDVPVVVAGGTLAYTENDPATVVTPGLTVADPDSSIVSASVQITANYASGQDVLGFVNGGGITGLWNLGTGTLSLSGTATPAAYQAALRTVTYVNGSDNPSAATRTVTWIVNDGTVPSVPVTSFITVAPVNDAPVADADAYGVNEGATLTVPAPGVLDGDTDAELTTLTTVLVTGPLHASAFTLNADGSFSYTHDGSETTTDTFTYRASDGALLSTVATVTITITPLNDAPIAVNDAYGVNEGATLSQAAPGVLINDTDAELSGLTASLVTGPAHASSFTLNPDGSFSYTHDGSETPLTDTFTYRAFDGVALSNVATVTITITPVNDAPVIDLDADDDKGTPGANYAFTFTEGDPTTFLQDATDATITDADTTTLTSLKVTLTNRLDPGFEVLDVDLVTGGFDTNFTKDYDITTDPLQGVLTITATTPQPIASFVTLLRRVTYSNSDLGPNPANRIVTFVAKDGTSDSAAATTTITVVTLNNAPVAVADSYGVNEGGTLAPVAPGVLGNDTDADGDTKTAVLVTGPSHAASFTLNPDGSFTYVHDGNGFAADSFTYKANDGIEDSNVVTVTITVTSVNDAPSFIKGADVTVLEDSGLHTAAGWATAISAGGAEESAQVLTFNASNDNNPLFSVQPAVAADGTLTFTPAANAFGTATVTLTLSDDGGVLNGGVDTSAPQTFVITLTPVNDAPSFIKGADQTVLEDSGAHSVSGWATAISAGPNEGGQTVAFAITANTNAALFSVAPAVSPTGVLSYTLAANANGTAAITLKITDDGGTANTGVDESATQAFNITVTAVNDAPSYTKGADETVLEDSGLHTTPGWATAISAGPADESSQTLAFVVTNNTNPALFAAVPTVDAITGDLTFFPAANAFGSATITLRLDDNGDTLNGGANQSPTQTFVINVTGVNDPPFFIKGADQTPLEDAAPVTVPGWATAISAGPNEADLLTFNVSNDNNALFSVQPSVAANGTLTYTLAANQVGSTTVSLSLTDDGSTPGVPGDDLTTAVQTFTITVTPVNDAPSFTAGATEIVPEDTPAQTVPGWATAISVGPANESSQTFSFAVTNLSVPGSLTFTSPPAVANDGTLTYTLAPNANGTGTFNVKLTDSGGVLNGGVDSVTHVLTIDVTAVNDAPSVTAGATLTFTEGNAATPIDTTVTVADVDNANIASATVQITGNYVNGQDLLAMPVTPGIGSAFAPLTGTLTLTGSTTKAAYQAALRTVTYFNNSSSPSEAQRTVTWIVSDGLLPSTGATSLITVIAVNSPPSGGPDSWQTFGNTELVVDQAGPSTPFVADTTPQTFGVLSNDTDPEGDPLSVVGIVGCPDVAAPFVCAIAGGGSVTMESNGRFTYTPLAGDITADTFQYQLRDQPTAGTPATVPVTVTLNFVDRIWYVNGNVAGPGTGTSTDPLKDLPSTIGDADDYVFVHDSTVSGGIALQNGQRLFGEGHGLSINQNLNGNGVSNLVAAGNSPTINATSADAVAILANTLNGNRTAIEIRGVTLSTSGGSFNAIDVTSANAANLGITIENVTITGATAEGIDVNHASSGTATVSLSDVTVTSTGNGIDINKSGAGTLTITGFGNMHVDGDTGGSGIVVTNATFDATAGAPYNQVDGQTTTVGDSGNSVGGAGVVLTNVTGDLAFDDLDIYAGNGTGLFLTSTGAVNVAGGTGARVSVAAGVAGFESTGGPVVDVTNATIDLPLASAIVNSSGTTGVSLVNVSDAINPIGPAVFSATTGSIASTTGISFNVSGGSAAISYGGSITQANNAATVSVSGGHVDSVSFSGTISATNGSGLQFDNANGTYGFTGTTTLNGGDAGIDILNGSTGTFSFGTGTAITNPSGTAFNLAASNANVTYSGSITDATGFAVDIDNHDNGIATFNTGTITSTGTGLRVANSGGGTINFNGPISLTTGTNKAVTLDTANAGGTINFNPSGAGLDISTTSGTGFSVLGGGTVTVQGSGNSINATSGTALDIATTALVTGGISFGSTTSAVATTAVRIAGVTPATATIALGTGSLAGTFRVGDGAGTANTGGTAIITYGGSITTSAATRTVDIQDRATGAGSITLSGALTHSGAGTSILLDQNAAGTIAFTAAGSVLNSGASTAVSLTGNTGATINFTGGGLDIDATSGGGFVATGGGTVTVTGSGNTILTTTGTALNVTGTNIGANDLTFVSIGSNGGSGNGIILDTTGSAGGLHVLGSGSAGSGGTIANKTGTNGSTTQGTGIYLNSTSDVSLDRMQLNDFDNFAIRGTTVTGFSLTNSTISGTNGNNNAGGNEEGSIRFDNLFTSATYPTAQITGSSISGGGTFNVKVLNSTASSTLNRLMLTSNTFGLISASIGNDNVDVTALPTGANTATVNVTLQDNFFLGTRSDFFETIADGNSTMDVVARRNKFTSGQAIIPGGGVALSIRGDVTGTADNVTFDLSCNNIVGAVAPNQANAYDTVAIFVAKGNGAGTWSGAIVNNLIGPAKTSPTIANADGIFVRATGSGTASLLIQNNVLTGYGNAGLHLQNNDGSVTMNATIFGNSLTSPNIQNFSAMFLDNGGTATDTTTMNAVIGGGGGQQNTVDGVVIDVSLGNFSTNTHFNLYKNGSGGASAATVIQDDNVGTPTVDTSAGSGPITLVAAGLPSAPATPAACSVPPLMAAGGERSIGNVCAVTQLADTEPVAAAAAARLFPAGTGGQPPLVGVRVAPSPLKPGQLGTVDGNLLLINPSAAGWGWFVDPTPDEDEEFEAPSATGERIAKAGGPADGKMDLLTALMHEMEHARGVPDLDAIAHPGELMTETLPVGVRRGPLPLRRAQRYQSHLRGGRMAEPFLSEIRIMSFAFAPKGWALSNGQLLPINQNQALFSLLGTTYGGDGRVSFGLPDLKGRVPIHMGSHTLGERGGEAAHTLSISELPIHTHVAQGSSVDATDPNPTNNLLATTANEYTPAANLTTLEPSSAGPTGGSQAHLNMQPFLVLNFAIALQGIFPSQT